MYIAWPEFAGGTNSAFVATARLTASRKRDSGTGGMQMKLAERAMRAAFWSGRKIVMAPEGERKAFIPS